MEPSGPSRDGPLKGQPFTADMAVVEGEPSCSLVLQMSVEEREGPETPQGLQFPPLLQFAFNC